MNERILCVDDDENILAAFQRQLRKQFLIETALGGEAGLGLFSAGKSFAVVVSDFRMPEMDGVEFLTKIREIAPNTVRIMLTGNADLKAAADAVNQGSIFRFLTKPCSTEEFAQALQAGVQQYRLVIAEKELLDLTLKGSIGVLTEILSILDAQSYGRACVLRDSVKKIAQSAGVSDTWSIELGAMLCEIGRVTIPAGTIVREKAEVPLSADEQDMLTRIPEIGYNLLAKIPRLEPVAQTILYQDKHFDGSGFPKDRVAGKQIPLGSRIVKIVKDLHQLESAGMQKESALASLRFREGYYDPDLLEYALKHLESQKDDQKLFQKSVRLIPVAELAVGQKLLSDVVTGTGALLITAGNIISESLLVRIRNFARLQNIREPIKIEAVTPR